MLIHEIPRSDWPAFLAAFGRQHEGWLATVEHLDLHGRLISLEGASVALRGHRNRSAGWSPLSFGVPHAEPPTEIADK